MSKPTGTEPRGPRLDRRGPDLPIERVRARVTAYVYGTVLALAAVLETGPDDVRGGYSLVVLLATTITTYLAHVLAYDIGGRIGRSADEHHRELRSEFRDALPIATSGALPAIPLVIGAFGWMPGLTAQIVALVLVVVRLGLTGWAVARQSNPKNRFAWWAGLGLAAIAGVIAVLKVALLH